MRELLRRLKITYMVYNFFHKKELQHNVPVYKKLGIPKQYYSPVSSKDFKKVKMQVPGFSKEALQRCFLFSNATEERKESMRAFDDTGFLILRGYLSEERVSRINQEIQQLMQKEKVSFRYKNKIMFAFHQSELIRSVGEDPNLKELIRALFGGDPVLFQSINFIMGSEQESHSDSIHMTTFPLGGLMGVWIALEDIDEDNGPLHYYPGSHKLPYYMNADYGNEGNFFLVGGKSYEAYEAMIQDKIKEHGIQKQLFTARKGDVLIWHANLFHGGQPHVNKNKTRKSMVFHYFRKDSVCYHEITQRPALIKP
ncbi:MAG: phytanoyl-CoA dioxygenase family protein [Cytophagaceae bacterium]|jgi:hypothetical protein|nr:phytanoyl-CoA dioxygenase family protein [Cytophagaceae bacterium]